MPKLSKIPEVTVWNPGGTEENLPLFQAVDKIHKILADEKLHQPHYWEWREAGTDMEETWNSGGNPIKGLRKTLDHVLPAWHDFGLTPEHAIALCMNLGLILSVDDTFGEDDAYASEDDLLAKTSL